jgi:hypothetical protein
MNPLRLNWQIWLKNLIRCAKLDTAADLPSRLEGRQRYAPPRAVARPGLPQIRTAGAIEPVPQVKHERESGPNGKTGQVRFMLDHQASGAGLRQFPTPLRVLCALQWTKAFSQFQAPARASAICDSRPDAQAAAPPPQAPSLEPHASRLIVFFPLYAPLAGHSLIWKSQLCADCRLGICLCAPCCPETAPFARK